MAGSDLDVVIRLIAKKQIKTLTDAAKERYGRLMAMAAKAKDKETKDHYKHIAKNTLLLAGAAARRLLITAENAADSYARSIKKAEEEKVVAKPPQKEPAKKQPAKEATKKEPAQKEPAKKEPVKQAPTKKQPAKKEAARKQKS
jgi:outer membrane biosynthesis protein TonB